MRVAVAAVEPAADCLNLVPPNRATWLGLRGLLQPLPAPVAAARVRPEERVAALARMATWRDIGAGLGPLAAGVLLPLVPAVVLYLGAAAVLVVSSLVALRK